MDGYVWIPTVTTNQFWSVHHQPVQRALDYVSQLL